MIAHTLKIRCPSWDHVENFYLRKVKDGNVLLARVPFRPDVGAAITLSLELPDGVQLDIAAAVRAVRQAPDGRKSAIQMELHGLDERLHGRLVSLVEGSRQGGPRTGPLLEPPIAVPRTRTGVPVPLPSDAPTNELVEPPVLRTGDEVDERVRELYRELEQDLSRLKEKTAHEVLGVDNADDVSAIRTAYFERTKRYHPDVLARHHDEDIRRIGSEIFIHVNKAYDRLRDAAVAAGNAIVAGPALLPHKGWIADFDDIGTVRPRKPLRTDDFSGPARAAAERVADFRAPDPQARVQVQFGSAVTPAAAQSAEVAAAAQPALRNTELFGDLEPEIAKSQVDGESEAQALADPSAIIEVARTLLADEQYDQARQRLAALLERDPRNREVRALYHVAYGQTLRQKGKNIEAQTQFEVALTHNPQCTEATAVVSALRPSRARRPSLLRRLFGGK